MHPLLLLVLTSFQLRMHTSSHIRFPYPMQRHIFFRHFYCLRHDLHFSEAYAFLPIFHCHRELLQHALELFFLPSLFSISCEIIGTDIICLSLLFTYKQKYYTVIISFDFSSTILSTFAINSSVSF